MPDLFLSPSTQKANLYVTGRSEQYWMNRLADEMEPYLRASGINVTRNDPNGSAVTSIRQSNRGNHDFHLSLHSNASPEALAGPYPWLHCILLSHQHLRPAHGRNHHRQSQGDLSASRARPCRGHHGHW